MTADQQFDLFSPPSPLLTSWEDLPAEEEQDPDALRFYQRDAYNAAIEALSGHHSALLVMATGLGKTQVFAAIGKHWDGPVLVLAHREELVSQARDRLEQMTGGLVEVEQGEWRASLNAKIVVGSVQSFNKKRLERMGKDRFSLVIADEAHRYLAPTYRRALDFFDAKRLGFTATPDRTDGKALGQIYETVAYQMDIERGIDSGYLVPILCRSVTLNEIKLDKVGKSGKDFKEADLDLAMLEAVEGIVDQTLKLEPGRQGIAFFPGVRSAELAMQKFNQHIPGSACFISGETDPDERRALVKSFKAGRYTYLCNCDIASEGFDAPSASLIIQGRPTMSRLKYVQFVGRGTRPLPGTVEAIQGRDNDTARRHAISHSTKPNMVVLDFVGNSTKHALVTMEDVLGGRYTPAEVKRAKVIKERSQGGDARAFLLQARRELEILARSTKAQVKATVRDFDPFKMFGIKVAEANRYANKYGQAPATEAQLAALRHMGVPDVELRGCSKAAASKLFGTILTRKKFGLANYAQMAALGKFGVWPAKSNIRFDSANAAISYATNQVAHGEKVDPLRVNLLLSQRRQAGDD